MAQAKDKLLVFYDGACPTCIRDRRWYEKLAGRGGDSVGWLDITGRDEEFKAQGVDPDKALRELHVKDSEGKIHQEMDAYILLMSRVPVLKPLAWLIGRPIIRPSLAALYHRWVARRLSTRSEN